MSDIRVSVQWKSSTVFAGEEVECTITFKNVAQPRSLRRSPSPSQFRGHTSHRERWKEALPMRSGQAPGIAAHRNSSSLPGFATSKARMHKQTLSLSTSNGFSPAPTSGLREGVPAIPKGGENKHRRSVSIVSLGGETGEETLSHGQHISSGRPTRGHMRSASLQVLPRRTAILGGGPSSATASDRSFTVPSPLLRTSPAFAEQRPSLHSSPRSSPHIGLENGTASPGSGKRDRSSISNFKFPQVPASIDEISGSASATLTDRSRDALGRTLSPRPNESGKGPDQTNLATRILSPASINGTPRSSGEFYSMSNNSTETLASEYIAPENNRLSYRPPHSRQGSSLAPMKFPQPEVLMMGYGQIMGSFTLDGSLVNQNPFDEAKRKGIIGGQGGGGVVRSNSTKRDTGLLGSFGWGNIGESLGGLLGGNELSSIKETKGSTNTRSIPILSTPQSILFVDLQLKPGESKSYTYSHPLPRGIPPTHKGRAIKIFYNLVVGTQRAAKVTQQHQVHHADIPFRVLPSVNGQGEILGHDLMSPHTILSNTALISSVDNLQKAASSTTTGPSTNRSTSSSTDFLSYVESLLDKPHQNSNAGLLSPTEAESRSRTPMANEPSTMKESIDLAILRSNTATSSARGVNRFEITRSGERVAVIMLARPAYRLGETIPVAIDFQDSDVACYSLHATLETSEVIDPAIALRSKASIHRAATRIHASQIESTVCAKKVLFNPMIPTTSTPEFITSAISLEWRLRFEFVTSRLGDAEADEDIDDLMEEVARDERGIVKAAVQGLPCETFDVTVPLRVYGNPSAFDERTEAGDFPI